MAGPPPRHRAPKEPKSVLNALQAFAVAGTAFSVVAVLSLLGGGAPSIDLGDPSGGLPSSTQRSAVVGSGSTAPTGVRSPGASGGTGTSPRPPTGPGSTPPPFVGPGDDPTAPGGAPVIPAESPASVVDPAAPPTESLPTPTPAGTTTSSETTPKPHPAATPTVRPSPPVTPGVPPVTPRPARTR